jgi:hypothetical protein
MGRGAPESVAGRWCDVFEIRDWLIQRCFIYRIPTTPARTPRVIPGWPRADRDRARPSRPTGSAPSCLALPRRNLGELRLAANRNSPRFAASGRRTAGCGEGAAQPVSHLVRLCPDLLRGVPQDSVVATSRCRSGAADDRRGSPHNHQVDRGVRGRRLASTRPAGTGARRQGLLADSVSEVRLDRWANGHVALVGDAASSVSLLGDGSTLAMAGAYTLAEELAATRADAHSAFARCEANTATWSTPGRGTPGPPR